MVDNETFRQIALSFPGTEENPHFERRAFKVTKRRIFATLHEATQSANMMFSLADQRIYCAFDKKAVYPVPNKFGLLGWTTFELQKLPVELISDALLAAYNDVMKAKPTAVKPAKKAAVKKAKVKSAKKSPAKKNRSKKKK